MRIGETQEIVEIEPLEEPLFLPERDPVAPQEVPEKVS